MITNILSCMILGDNKYVDADTGDCDDVGALQLLLVGQRRKDAHSCSKTESQVVSQQIQFKWTQFEK